MPVHMGSAQWGHVSGPVSFPQQYSIQSPPLSTLSFPGPEDHHMADL